MIVRGGILGLTLVLLSKIFGTEYSVDPLGEATENKDEEYRLVTFHNKYKQPIFMFWTTEASSDGDYLFPIRQYDSIEVATTAGHIFYATFDEDGTSKVAPTSITIKDGIDEYVFGYTISNISVNISEESHPLVKIIGKGSTLSMLVKFRCLAPEMEMYYEDGNGGQYNGKLQQGKESSMTTYPGHIFFFTTPNNKTNELARLTIKRDKVLYSVWDPLHPPPSELRELNDAEEEFQKEYANRTGIPWRHFFGPDGPRPPPSLFMWPASAVGDIHNVTSPQGYWSCDGAAASCQSAVAVQLQLEVVSLQPRVFIISDFLSSFEADQIKAYAEPRMWQSAVGRGRSFSSEMRTSRNAWVPRETSDIIDSLHRRAADLLRVDESLLYNTKNVEDLQVVHYVDGQRYDSHHDWGVNGYAEERMMTLLLYLTNQPDSLAGGETAFPKGAEGKGFKIQPKKGTAVLFYNLLEDGNGDDLALHASLPVLRGEKWLANFWVWDPKVQKQHIFHAQ